ncbi:conserved hypothetical protein [Candida dubliniensis CD36]|uniref:Uncharacterized protein n=1 Tax=Candida dubliniensis (strain CD36 / ATCC MYA-646 / CBS 7987 / NCPF 3949 / NRRL Y-17841) TaxID=573826 RepID=B9WIW5_CANDC|nr:conserved hypothetical protein [Candida dubliniensis CD36]CAX41183.1 conserved hypothetical protein [Candida dubliniensis CD36]
MYKPKFNFRPNAKGIILNKPVINISTTFDEISKLPSFRSKLLAFYKRFYKLRKFECNEQLYIIKDIPYYTPDINDQDYAAFVKRQFRSISYNTKREAILNLPALSEQELEQRMMNTLVFVFNHTVTAETPYSNNSSMTEDDVAKTGIDNEETKIVSTILKLDNEMPNDIKYDFKFKWFKEFTNQLDSIDPKVGPTKKQLEYLTEHYGYRMYYITLMRLNESTKLCL